MRQPPPLGTVCEPPPTKRGGWQRSGTQSGLVRAWGDPAERVETRSGRAPEDRNRGLSRVSSQIKRASRPRGILIEIRLGIRVESRERSGCTRPLRYWTRQAGAAAPYPEVPGPGVPPPPRFTPHETRRVPVGTPQQWEPKKISDPHLRIALTVKPRHPALGRGLNRKKVAPAESACSEAHPPALRAGRNRKKQRAGRSCFLEAGLPALRAGRNRKKRGPGEACFSEEHKDSSEVRSASRESPGR